MEIKEKKYIDWIDGLRGIACIMILVHHFMVGFFPASYYGETVAIHGNHAWETIFSQTPLGVVINGNFWVCVFCSLSGLVQAYKIIYQDDLSKIGNDMVKRYFRLALPVFVVSFMVFIMMQLNLFYNVNANKIVQSPWFGAFYAEKVSLKTVFVSSFVTVWFNEDATFSNAFWMLKYIFLGSYLTLSLIHI